MADGKVTIEIILEGKKLKAQIDKAALQTETKFKESGKKAGKAFGGGFGASIKSIAIGNFIAQQLQNALRLITQAFKQSVQDVRDFSRGIAEINSILPANAKLTREAKDAIAGFSREFASDAQAQAKSFYNIVSAGVRGTANQLETLRVSNQAAVAGLVDINSAAKVLIQSVNSYSKSGLTAQQASDALFIAVREGVTTFGELSSFIGNTTAIAASSGVAFSELTGSIAFLTKQGITTDKAVIGLRQTIASIIKPSADAQKAARTLGIDFSATALKSKGLQAVLLDVAKATGGNSAAIAKLFGNIRAFNVVNAIANGNLADFNRILKETKNSTGATASAFDIISKNLDFQFRKTFAVIRSVFLGITRAFAQTFGSSIQVALNNIQSFLLDGVVPVAKFVNNYIIAPFELAFNFIRDSLQFINGLFGTILSSIAVATSNFVLAFAEVGNKVGIISDEAYNSVKKFADKSGETLKFFANETGTAFDNLFEGTVFGKGEEFIANLQNNLTVAREEIGALEPIDIPVGPNLNNPENLFDPVAEEAKKAVERMNKAFNNTLANGIANGIQRMTIALAQGKNVMQQFGVFVIDLIGDLAIQMGKIFIATGLAQLALFSSPGASILAGAALIAAGTLAKQLFGSGATVGGGGAPTSGGGIAAGGGNEFASTVTEQQEPEEREASTQVAVNIQGDVLDSDETGLRIVNLIQNAFDENDVKVSGGAFA